MHPISIYPLRQESDPREISFTAQHGLLVLSLAITVYAFFVYIALFLSRNGVNNGTCLSIVHFAGALSLFLFWKNGRWGNARFDSFGAALLLFSIAFRVQAIFDALMFGTRIDTLYQFPNLPIPANDLILLSKGEIITTSVILLVAYAWRLKIGKDIEKYSFINSSIKIPMNILLFVYGTGLVFSFLTRIQGFSFGALEQAVSLMMVTSVAAIYFIAARARSGRRKVLQACALALPIAFTALNSGSKEALFFPFIPAAILFATSYRRWPASILLISTAVFILAISQMYVGHVREIVWFDKANSRVTTIDLVYSFIENFEETNIDEAVDDVSSRINMSTSHAITVTLADGRGHDPYGVFGLIPVSFIPRIFWPDKPAMQPGAMHTARILGYDGPVSEMTTSTAAGFGTELYLGGWWIGVFCGAVGYGLLLASAQKRVLKFGSGLPHLATCFVALYWTIRFDEMHVLYAYTSIVFLIIFAWLLTKIVATFGIQHSARIKKSKA